MHDLAVSARTHIHCTITNHTLWAPGSFHGYYTVTRARSVEWYSAQGPCIISSLNAMECLWIYDGLLTAAVLEDITRKSGQSETHVCSLFEYVTFNLKRIQVIWLVLEPFSSMQHKPFWRLIALTHATYIFFLTCVLLCFSLSSFTSFLSGY